MVRTLLFVGLLALCRFASANLISATWGTEPQSPVYAGQPYALTLTLETLPNEEISGVQLTQGAGRPPERQRTYEQNNRRYTVLYWKQLQERPKLVAIPAGRVIADVTQIQTFGFMRTANTTRQALTLAAFNYDIEALPDEAQGMPIGSFTLQLTADNAAFVPGEVRLLTATINAKEGAIPESYALELEETTDGILYPFQWIEKKEQTWVAQAYLVTSAEHDFQLRLKPMKIFDLATRTPNTVTCAPLQLRVRQAEEAVIEDTTLSLNPSQTATQGKQLRFAPAMSAPVLGLLTESWQEVFTYDEWVYVRSPSIAGWIRKAELKDEQP